MKRVWILTALGKDRPGIVASVTRVLFQLGCNLEDSAMTRLAGEFAIMLILAAPGRLTQERLERAFGSLAHRLTLAVHLKALTRAELTSPQRGKPYLLSVYGADRPGIVYRVSDLLARSGVNISDVSTHRTSPKKGKAAKPLYLMVLEVELPTRVRASHLETRLRRLAASLGVEASLRSAEAQVL